MLARQDRRLPKKIAETSIVATTAVCASRTNSSCDEPVANRLEEFGEGPARSAKRQSAQRKLSNSLLLQIFSYAARLARNIRTSIVAGRFKATPRISASSVTEDLETPKPSLVSWNRSPPLLESFDSSCPLQFASPHWRH